MLTPDQIAGALGLVAHIAFTVTAYRKRWF